jgi:NAD(P) transhydrogenase subunit alpha
MSEEFIDAEMKLFREQAAEVNVIITTALVPGAKAPVLVPEDVVDALKPGSIVVDLAAEQGGNCALTRPDEIVDHHGVKILGYTDLVSRMGHSASRFFSANVTNLLTEMVADGALAIDLDDEVIRGACVAHGGEVLPPPKRPEPSPKKPAAPSRPPPAANARPAQKNIMSPTRRAWGTTVGGMIVVLLLFLVGRFAPADFLQHLTVFVLACFVGWQVIWSVTPALHTPLMSVTNAISGIIIVGGMLQVGTGRVDLAGGLGVVAILVAAINISGGFLVTQRMLAMFRKDGPK